MSAEKLIAEVQSTGARFELEGDGFRIRAPHGTVTPEMREELAAHKAEIIALLTLADTEVSVSYSAGDCPHCSKPLLAFTHPLETEVWIQCPTAPEIFKAFERASPIQCLDCGVKPVIAGRCAECIRRVVLAPDAPCPICGCLRFWRHLANAGKVVGFALYCANCFEPTGPVAIYQISA